MCEEQKRFVLTEKDKRQRGSALVTVMLYKFTLQSVLCQLYLITLESIMISAFKTSLELAQILPSLSF